MMRFIDAHAHLSLNNELDKALIVALNEDEYQKLNKCNYDIALGIHPLMEEWDYEKYLADKKIKAIGEIGLDYRNEVNRDKQIALFKKQLALAEGYQKPVVVHSVAAARDTLDCLKDFEGKLYLHGYSMSGEYLKLFSENTYFGFGMYLLKEGYLKQKKCLKEVALERLLIESDYPYCERYDLEALYNYIAQIKNISISDLVKQVALNYQNYLEV